jgi:UDP-N-acetylmuramoyl-L-alanyl-D-glutamate--2,6-diaminopimelate ligase
MEKFLRTTEKFIPKKIYRALQPAYHIALAWIAAVWYGFPSRKIKVIAVTGTKGKSSTVELIAAMLEASGHKVALSNTIRFKIAGDERHSRPNLFKMSMPGRGFMQRFIRDAVRAGCDYAVIEMTSQGAALYRHKFINIGVFVVTNISPEHIESHGSYEKYLAAKLAIGRQFEKSQSREKVLIINKDDPGLRRFAELKADAKIEYSLGEMKPYSLLGGGAGVASGGLEFTYDCTRMSSHLSGLFNLYNILAAIKTAERQGVPMEKIADALRAFKGIRGRVERIEAGQDFTVIVDYAHTVDSLEKIYKVFRPDPSALRSTSSASTKLIGVLGGTGGGRDRWKRKEMGKIAARYCDEIILTNEDPYDENPMQIIDDVKGGAAEATVILDRRLAIREAIRRAKTGDIILITGKGTDPFIMGANGDNIPWSDAQVAREELENKEKNLSAAQ